VILRDWKRVVGLLCSFMLVMTLTTMLGISEAKAVEKVKLKFTLICGLQEIPAWQGMVDAFNKQSPTIKVELERLPGGWDEFKQKMMARIAGGSPSDIGRMSPVVIPGFEKVGALVDLMPFIEAEKFDLTQYWEAAINAYKKGGHMYGFPAGIYTQATYYNKNLFDEAGLSYPPTDWKDNTWNVSKWLEYAKKLTKGEGPTKQFGTYIDSRPHRFFTWHLWNNGADFINEEKTKCVVTEPAAIEALQFVQDLIWKYEVATTPINYKLLGAIDLFKSGRLGMFESGQWHLPAAAQIKDFKWGVVPNPAGKAGRFSTIWADPYSIFKGSKHPKEAWEAIKFFAGEGGNVLAEYGIMGTPVNKSVTKARRAELYEPLPPEEKQVWWDTLTYARMVRIPSVWDEYVARISDQLELLVLNKMSAEETAKRICSEVDSLLK